MGVLSHSLFTRLIVISNYVTQVATYKILDMHHGF